MKFKALPITDLTDATLDFEQLQTRNILDSTNQSFLQLLTAQKLQVQAGAVTVTWPGGTQVSNTAAVTFPVAFSTAITAITLGATLTAGGSANAPNYSSITLSGFNVVSAAFVVIAATSTTVEWIAIGH